MYEKIITYKGGKISDKAEYYKQLLKNACSNHQIFRQIMQLVFLLNPLEQKMKKVKKQPGFLDMNVPIN